MNKNKTIIVFLLILIFGSFLRFYKLDLQSLWLDELVTKRTASLENVQEVINLTAKVDVHPPGFYMISHYWIKIIGSSEIDIRLLSAICGSLAILAVFVLTMKLYSKREALISALLVAVFWFPVYYSQEARPYSLLFLFSVVSTIFYYPLVKKFYRKESSKTINTILYMGSIIVTSYIHYFGTYLVFLQGVFLFLPAIRNKKNFYEWLIIYLTVIIFFLPWIPYMLMQYGGKIAQSRHSGQEFIKMFRYLIFIFNNSKIVLLVTFIVIGFLMIIIFKNKRLKPKEILKSLKIETVFLIAWFFVPLLTIIIISYYIKPVFSFRNMIITYAPVPILISRLVVKADFHKKAKKIIIFLFVIFLLYNLVLTKEYYSKPTKEQFRGVAKFVISEYNPEEKTEIFALTYSKEFFNYYFRIYNSKVRVKYKFEESKDLQTALDKYKLNSFWLISGHKKFTKELLKKLNEKFHLIKQKKFIGAQALLYKRK